MVQSTPIQQPTNNWFRVNCPNCSSTLQAQLGPGVSSVQCGYCQFVFPVQAPAAAPANNWAGQGQAPGTFMYDMPGQDGLGVSSAGKIRKKSKPHLCKRVQPDGSLGCGQKAHPNQRQCSTCSYCKALCKCQQGYSKATGGEDDQENFCKPVLQLEQATVENGAEEALVAAATEGDSLSVVTAAIAGAEEVKVVAEEKTEGDEDGEEEASAGLNQEVPPGDMVPVDTSGDGNPDSLAIDTTGDGLTDTIVRM